MNVKKININQSELTYDIISDVDDEPITSSDNLVKSGGVKDSVNNSILATTNILSNNALSKNSAVNNAVTYLGYFNVKAGHTYEIFVKSDLLIKNGNVAVGLGYNGNTTTTGRAIQNGFTWKVTAKESTDKGRVYIDMHNGNEGIPVFVSIQDISVNDAKEEKWYVGSNEPIFNSSHSVTFSPIVERRTYNGTTNAHSTDIFDIIKTTIDNFNEFPNYIHLSYDTNKKTITIIFYALNNTHCAIYYNNLTDSYRFVINKYDMYNNEIMVLDICSTYQGM